MDTSLERCLSMTLVLVALSISACQGQGNNCDINSRPHPNGICGNRLARAHSNLCFLLSQAYPNHFPGKRSVDNGNLIDRIYNIPLSVLADLDFSRYNWETFWSGRDDSSDFVYPSTLLTGDDTQPSALENQSEPANNRMSWSLLHMLKKRSNRIKRNASQSSMVCDCCYNMCTPRHLATYC